MPKDRKKTSARRERSNAAAIAAVVAVALAAVVVAVWFWREGPQSTPRQNDSASASLGLLGERKDSEIYAQYAGSESCKECHATEHELWRTSHHALGERAVDPAMDTSAFAVSTPIYHGSFTSSVQCVDGRFEIVTAGPDGKVQPFQVDRVIGHSPLRQFLIAMEDGRVQTAELAFHPATGEWFDVFGDENRVPGEWGHWTGRGMTWNQMCASCHNTRLRKHYDIESDTYATTMAERSVSCESCHGGMADHVRWQKQYAGRNQRDPTLQPFDREQMLATCGACHARRGDLTGEFEPGDSFFDHFHLTIPDETDVYYPDGQVRDENYEFTSFLSSRMYAAGVSCKDCHEPHSGKVYTLDNALCMKCHAQPIAPAPKIDALTHSRHTIGGGGDRCVDCHMPLTTYMQKDPRRDHGFTIPDPLLTKEHGIPNACNRCHTDRDADWALAAVTEWYGARMNRPTRARAMTIAKAREGRRDALDELLRVSREESLGVWRATATRLLEQWAGDAKVKAGLLERVGDADPMVRAQAAHALSALHVAGDAKATSSLEFLLRDPVRTVRIQAAWALRTSIDTNSPAGKELMASLKFNADQPTGAAQLAVFLMDRGSPQEAMSYWKRSVQWDKNSAPLREGYAVCLSLVGRSAEATEELRAACRLAPEDGHYRYKLGLALNEQGKLTEAMAALEEAVKLDPERADAWYNLGLGYAAMERLDDAMQALARAETIDPTSARIPYARATVLARMRIFDQARIAAQRALELQPGYADATALLGELQRR